jgi:hypothetical protein
MGGVSNFSDKNSTNIYDESVVDVSPLIKDSFGRVRVSNPINIFEYTFKNDSDFDIYWDTDLVGSATTQQINQRVVRELAVTTATNDKAILQSRRYFEYYPGKSHLMHYTANFKGAQTGVRKRHGIFDHNNGIYFEADGEALYLCYRSNISGSVVNTRIAQANWNGDKLDGTGPSGHTANPSNKYLFWIDYSWLSVCGIRWGVYVNNTPIILHAETFSGEQTDSYMASAVLPFRTEIETTGSPSSVDSIEVTCCGFHLEGQPTEIGKVRFQDSGFAEITVNSGAANRLPLLVLRLDPNKPYTSAELFETAVTVTSGNSTVHWEIFLNPTITGTPTWVDNTNSQTEYASNATSLSISGGLKIGSGYARVNDDSAGQLTDIDIRLGRAIDGTPDIVVLSAATISSNSKVVWTQSWKEYE